MYIYHSIAILPSKFNKNKKDLMSQHTGRKFRN